MQSIHTLTRTSIRTLAAALLVSSVAALPAPAFADAQVRMALDGRSVDHREGNRVERDRNDTAYRVDTREYGNDAGRHDADRDHADRGYGDRGYGDRSYGDRRQATHWETLTQLRTHSEGRGHQHVVLPRDTRVIRLAATHRRTVVLAAFIQYPDGRRVRVPGLEGRLDGRAEVRTQLRHRGHRPAVLHLVTEPVRDGRRAYFEVLAAR